MPELPEVETVRRSLEPLLVGRRIKRVRVRDPRLRYPVDVVALRKGVCGRQVEGLGRRAKYLILRLSGGKRLVIHLGMSGRLLYVPAAEPLGPHVHVVFSTDDGRTLRFRDHRRFGLVDVLEARELDQDRRFRELGVEPLSRACSAEYFHRRSRGLRKPVKNFLMDARQVVGVGNIYASEALHTAGVHPARPAGRMSLATWKKVTRSVKSVLRAAIRQGGTTLSDFQDATGEAGYFQVRLQVYGREGEPCGRCGRSVRRTVQAGRSTFYCPGCQR